MVKSNPLWVVRHIFKERNEIAVLLGGVVGRGILYPGLLRKQVDLLVLCSVFSLAASVLVVSPTPPTKVM